MPAPSIHGFSEKVALINGADDPVGRAIAIQLALNGTYVIAGFSGESDESRRALGALQDLGTLAFAVGADASTPEGAGLLVGEAEKNFGRLDMLVNCVRTSSAHSFDKASAADFDAVIGKSAKAAVLVTQAAVGLMKSRPKPKIVNVVSAYDADESPGDFLGQMAQGAVIGLTTFLAGYLPANFRSNIVAVTETKPSDVVDDDELLRRPAGVAPDDVARTIMFLLSSESIGLNGQLLKVN